MTAAARYPGTTRGQVTAGEAVGFASSQSEQDLPAAAVRSRFVCLTVEYEPKPHRPCFCSISQKQAHSLTTNRVKSDATAKRASTCSVVASRMTAVAVAKDDHLRAPTRPRQRSEHSLMAANAPVVGTRTRRWGGVAPLQQQNKTSDMLWFA